MRRLLLLLAACVFLAAAGCDLTPEEDPGYHVRGASAPAACETS